MILMILNTVITIFNFEYISWQSLWVEQHSQSAEIASIEFNKTKLKECFLRCLRCISNQPGFIIFPDMSS